MEPVKIHDSMFYNCDCISGAVESIPNNSVDLIITDPPYGINGDKLHQHYNRDEKFVVDGYEEVPSEKYAKFSLDWIREAERVLRPGGSIYIISGYTNLYFILHALREVKLKEVNHIIWKYNFGVFTNKKYVSSHYHILYYQKNKGSRTFNVESRFGLNEKFESGRSQNYTDREDVWMISRQYKPRTEKNKNELPEELLKKMIQYSSNEGDLICDFFLGGFSTAKAAIGLNRRVIGFEKSSAIFNRKIKEIKKLKNGDLLSSLRVPITDKPKNQRTRWSAEDRERLYMRFNELSSKGLIKKDIMNCLQDEFQRGYWAIERALKNRCE